MPKKKTAPKRGTQQNAEKPLILIADDHEGIRIVLRAFFEEEGFRVILARTIEEGVALAIEKKPDLAILDLKTQSKMDGHQGLAEIKRSGLPTKLILYTGNPLDVRVEERIRKQAQENGADRVFFKPTDNNMLLAAVTKLLSV